MNPATVLRQVADAGYGKCQACGDSPLVSEWHSTATLEHTLTARCHGSTETLTLDVGVLRFDPDGLLGRIYAWMRDLFRLDAFPDMMELLAYNRGRLPKPRKLPQP